MLGKKNVRYSGIFKASKKTNYITHISKTARAKSFVENIRLETYVTILTEPDLFLQN